MNERKLVIVGDQAYFEEEWEAERRQREHDRNYHRGYYQRNRERLQAYNREWMRAKREKDRATWPLVTGWLHSLSCHEPHRTKRRTCVPIPVVK